MKTWLIPHPNVPNAEFGDAHLKRVTTLFNENFAKLDALMQAAQASVKELDTSKSNDGHNHDEDYAQLEHKHIPDDVTGLSDLLDNKANLNHEHSQYLTEITAHQHETNEVNGLLEALNGKAPTAHGHTFSDVDGLDDLSANAARTAYVDQRDTEKLAAAKAYTDAAISGIDVPEASSLTPYEDKVGGAVGTATSFAHGDHRHKLNYPPNKPTTDMKADGMGENHSASFGDTNNYADLGHSHPLNFDPNKTASALAPDGNGEGGMPQFGNSNYYADMFHSHPLNVVSSGNPSDVVKSTGTASPGTSTRYARHDHVHKMPALTGDDIAYTLSTSVSSQIQTNVQSITTNTEELLNHEGRITTLEARPSGGSVNSVDNVGPTNGNVQLNALTTTNYSTTLGTVYQAYSAKLTAVQTNIDDNGNVLLSGVKGNIEGHTGNCLVTIDNSGTLGHSGNAAYTLLNNAVKGDGGAARGAHLLVTDLDLGNGLEADSSTYKPKVKPKANGGIDVSSDGVAVKCKTSGGISVDENGLALNVSGGTGFVKQENGTLSVPTEQPITLPSGSGYLKSNGTETSVASTIPVSDVNFGQGVTNITTANIAANAVTSVNGNSGSVLVTPFPGFGGTGSATTASHSDHKHTSDDITDLGTAAKKNVGETNGVQAYSAKLTALDGTLNDNGTMPVRNIYDSACTSSCLAISTNGVFGHSSSGLSNTASFGGDWPTLQAMSQCFTVVSGALRVLFNKISGGSGNANKVVTTDSSGNVATNNPGDGLKLESGTLSVKTDPNGGISTTSNGVSLSDVRNEQITLSDMVYKVKNDQGGYVNYSIYFKPPIFDKKGRYIGYGNPVLVLSGIITD